jgi:hypothetical protein
MFEICFGFEILVVIYILFNEIIHGSSSKVSKKKKKTRERESA